MGRNKSYWHFCFLLRSVTVMSSPLVKIEIYNFLFLSLQACQHVTMPGVSTLKLRKNSWTCYLQCKRESQPGLSCAQWVLAGGFAALTSYADALKRWGEQVSCRIPNANPWASATFVNWLIWSRNFQIINIYKIGYKSAYLRVCFFLNILLKI